MSEINAVKYEEESRRSAAAADTLIPAAEQTHTGRPGPTPAR